MHQELCSSFSTYPHSSLMTPSPSVSWMWMMQRTEPNALQKNFQGTSSLRRNLAQNTLIWGYDRITSVIMGLSKNPLPNPSVLALIWGIMESLPSWSYRFYEMWVSVLRSVTLHPSGLFLGVNPFSMISQISCLRAAKARSSFTNLCVRPSRTLARCLCFESQSSISSLNY